MSVILGAFAEYEFYTATPRSLLAASRPEVLFLYMSCNQHGDLCGENGLAVITWRSHL